MNIPIYELPICFSNPSRIISDSCESMNMCKLASKLLYIRKLVLDLDGSTLVVLESKSERWMQKSSDRISYLLSDPSVTQPKGCSKMR